MWGFEKARFEVRIDGLWVSGDRGLIRRVGGSGSIMSWEQCPECTSLC